MEVEGGRLKMRAASRAGLVVLGVVVSLSAGGCGGADETPAESSPTPPVAVASETAQESSSPSPTDAPSESSAEAAQLEGEVKYAWQLVVGDCWISGGEVVGSSTTYLVRPCEYPHMGEVFLVPTPEQCLGGEQVAPDEALSEYVGVRVAELDGWLDEHNLQRVMSFEPNPDGEQSCPASIATVDDELVDGSWSAS
jgi:hypothetical protein